MRSLDDSPEYYRLRETHEREAAEKAANDAIRNIHLAMAAKYQKLAAKVEMVNDN